MKICTVDGCDKKHKAHGMCRLHYQRSRQTKATPLSVEDRFWQKVAKSDDCWEWTAYKTHLGYGRFALDGKAQAAHRVSYQLSKGDIPEGLEIDHTCHNRGCVRPDHLRLATRKQNNENLSSTRKNNTSGVRGVTWFARRGLWMGQVWHEGRCHHVGLFEDIAEADAAVRKKRLELFTHNELDKAA